ncbi:MAG: PfkB family carbohydrate kinase [bacterium]|nr:PfkB family carbohydrate kinase [bacterium]
MDKHHFVSIGDIVTDAFIKLQVAEVKCDSNEEHCTISMPYGDKIPYESVEVIRAVGNCANASVAAARLGLNSSLIANLGDDQNGKECVATLEANKVDVKYLTIHPGKETNYHYVLWFEHDRTILVKHQEYEYKLPDLHEPSWLYLTSLGEQTREYHKEIVTYLKANPAVSLAFQPGTFQIKLGKEELKEIYERTNIFFCNIEEAEKILNLSTLGIEELLKRMYELGPKIVVITDGPKGAYAYNGENSWLIPAYPDQKPAFERTGAGDAFASTTVSALALGKDLQTALLWGAVNSMSVVQQVGAQKGLLTVEQIEVYLKTASPDFKVSVI